MADSTCEVVDCTAKTYNFCGKCGTGTCAEHTVSVAEDLYEEGFVCSACFDQLTVQVKVEDGGIYLFGEDGHEIVCWVDTEMIEAPEEVCYAIAGSIKMLYERGGEALRTFIASPDAKTSA